MGYCSDLEGEVMFDPPIPRGRPNLFKAGDDPFQRGVLRWDIDADGAIAGFAPMDKVGGWKLYNDLQGWLTTIYRWVREDHPDTEVEGYIKRRGEEPFDAETFCFSWVGLTVSTAVVTWTEPKVTWTEPKVLVLGPAS